MFQLVSYHKEIFAAQMIYRIEKKAQFS